MNIYEELNWALKGFRKSATPSVADAATEVSAITEDYRQGKLSREEYLELVDDLLDLERVSEQMYEQETKQEVAKALELLKNAIGPILGLLK